MKDYQAPAIVDALRAGKQFSFESYSADAREVLSFTPIPHLPGLVLCDMLAGTHNAG